MEIAIIVILVVILIFQYLSLQEKNREIDNLDGECQKQKQELAQAVKQKDEFSSMHQNCLQELSQKARVLRWLASSLSSPELKNALEKEKIAEREKAFAEGPYTEDRKEADEIYHAIEWLMTEAEKKGK